MLLRINDFILVYLFLIILFLNCFLNFLIIIRLFNIINYHFFADFFEEE